VRREDDVMAKSLPETKKGPTKKRGCRTRGSPGGKR
jgi:hypothetical protein